MHARVLSVICVLLVIATALATTQAPSTSTPPTTSTIPSGYTYYQASGSYYKFHRRHVTWDLANITCASEGAHVVVLNDAEEADIVARVVKDGSTDYYPTWTGLRDYRTGGVMDWRTVHGEPLSDVFNVWGEGRPDNNPRHTCTYFGTYSKLLSDWYCTARYYVTCEISQQ